VKGDKDNRFAKLKESMGRLHSLGDCGRRRRPRIIERVIQELQAALDELQVIEEELRFQHDELLMARKDSEDHRRRYRQLLDLISERCLVTDMAGKIREANAAAAAALGIDRELLSGKLMANLVVAEQRGEFQERLGEMSRLQRIDGWPVRFRPGGDEPPFDARVTVEVIRAADDFITGLMWIIKAVPPK